MILLCVRGFTSRPHSGAASPLFSTYQCDLFAIITDSQHHFKYALPSFQFASIVSFYYTRSPLVVCILLMDDMLASMWNSLSLAESEAITLTIDEANLSLPKFALIGKLAMKKFIHVSEVDRNLTSHWRLPSPVETNLVGDNAYLFSFADEFACERVLNSQP